MSRKTAFCCKRSLAKLWPLLLVPGFMLLSGCRTSLPEPGKVSSPSVHGVAVAAHPAAAAVGAEILEMGGNAADAAVATGFAISVVEPSMNSIGGRALALLRDADGSVRGYNGMTEVPKQYQRPSEPPSDGYQVIATPGVVATLAKIHQEEGSLPWEVLLKPAVRLAEEGFQLTAGEAARITEALPKYTAYPALQKHFAGQKNGRFKAGDRLRQPDLAATLRILAAEGASAFYRGQIAAAIAEDMAENGGFLTASDLAGYRVRPGRYIKTRYRGYEVHALAAPGGGGLVVKALNILENLDLAEMDETAWAAAVHQALTISFNTIHEDYREQDLEQLLSKEWAKKAADSIQVPGSLSAESAEGAVRHPYRRQQAAAETESPHTTHFVITDCTGMSVSITQTVGPILGSRIMTPGLGFVYATTMGTYLSARDESPGSRPRTTVSPTLVTRNGEPVFALGAAGGLRIASGIVQTISRHVDRQLPLAEAVAAPRIHPKRIRKNGRREASLCCFHAETTPGGWTGGQLADWRQAGFEVSGDDRTGAFARVHAAGKMQGGWYGVADPDWEGEALAAETSHCSAE